MRRSGCATELSRLGCPVVDLIEGRGIPWSGPRARVVPGRPTLLIYGHYDVQPPDPLEEWESPPFEPTVREGKLYARGAADDKGQVFCLLKAYEAVLDEDGRPPLNVHFIFEGEEECGGQVIFDLLRAEPERTRADAVLVCDMLLLRARIARRLHRVAWPVLRRDLGSHAAARPPFGDLWRRGAQRARDAGPDPERAQGRRRRDPHSQALQGGAEALEEGAQGLAASSPSTRRRSSRDEVTGQALTGLKDYSVLERTWALPTLEIHGIRGGFVGDGAKTVIPAHAVAKVSLRLVPGQRYEKVGAAARARRRPPGTAVGRRERHACCTAAIRWRSTVDHPAFAVLDEAFEEVVGSRTVPVRSGGSIPIVPELGLTGAPVILTGIGLPDDGLHSPNEKLDLAQLWSGIRGVRTLLRAVRGAGWRCGGGSSGGIRHERGAGRRRRTRGVETV